MKVLISQKTQVPLVKIVKGRQCHGKQLQRLEIGREEENVTPMSLMASCYAVRKGKKEKRETGFLPYKREVYVYIFQ